MKLGLFNMGTGVADPSALRNIAQAADAAGLESLWCGEHVVLPKPREAPSPADPDHAFLHPSAVLSFLAAVTDNVKLGTGIVLIAQRNPVVLAKEFASARRALKWPRDSRRWRRLPAPGVRRHRRALPRARSPHR